MSTTKTSSKTLRRVGATAVVLGGTLVGFVGTADASTGDTPPPVEEVIVLDLQSAQGGMSGFSLRLFKAPDGGAFEDVTRTFGLG